jgi:ribosomal protein S18 acetylase RimI-like enzyme
MVLRRAGYWTVRSPSNPGHYWGNWLLFDRPPEPGDGARWQARFAAEFPELGHCALAWDVTDGALGATRLEFPDFELEQTVGLVAPAGGPTAHPRANPEVQIRALSAQDAAWDGVLALWEAQNAEREDAHPADAYQRYARSRLGELRALFAAGRGAWFVAEERGVLVGSLGVVVTDGRARYQSVDTAASHRRRGIASRLVYEAAQQVRAAWTISSFVIAADLDYHALGIYESLGFQRIEQVSGVCRWAPEDRSGP